MPAEPEQGLGVERLALRGEELAPGQPQGLQVVDELVEELEVEPADRVDEAGVLLGDVVDQRPERHRAVGLELREQVDRAGQDRLPRLVAPVLRAVIHHPRQGRGGVPRDLAALERAEPPETGRCDRDRQGPALRVAGRVDGDVHPRAELLAARRPASGSSSGRCHDSGRA